MRYLVTTKTGDKPFLTNWFDEENNFNISVGMIVYDLAEGLYMEDGEEWQEIEEDSL